MASILQMWFGGPNFFFLNKLMASKNSETPIQEAPYS